MAVSDMWAPSDESFSSVISSCETWPVSYHTDDSDLCCSCCRNSPLEHCRALVTDHNHRTVLRSPLVSTTDRHHMLSFWHCCVVTTDKQYCDPPTLHPASQLIQIIAALSSAPGIYISLLFLCSSQNMKERHREMLFISCKEWKQIFMLTLIYLFEVNKCGEDHVSGPVCLQTWIMDHMWWDMFVSQLQSHSSVILTPNYPPTVNLCCAAVFAKHRCWGLQTV